MGTEKVLERALNGVVSSPCRGAPTAGDKAEGGVRDSEASKPPIILQTSRGRCLSSKAQREVDHLPVDHLPEGDEHL